MNLTQNPHRRFNPLADEWILVSPHRTSRPWQGAVEATASEKQLTYDPQCYLCPGNSRIGGVQNPKYTSTFVFQNDFAALKENVPDEKMDVGNKGLLVAKSEIGVCKVICFSPRHDLTLATMQPREIEEVVRVWTDQYKELGANPHINHVQIFENRGAMMGASNPHPHCQIWATESIPGIPQQELQTQQKYLKDHSSCLLCDYIAVEAQEKSRIVCQNDAFVAYVPFWAVWPFEILLCSRRHLGSFTDLTKEDQAQLSAILKQITSTYDKVFNVPFPYSMGFHPSPTDNSAHPEWHFHAHFYPPLLRSATIKKFMVGFEMLGSAQRDITPEAAAERLRALAQGT
ncbi:MAG TPA: UDP-glucose--hexose-1-phosphate uridylyltransferase [Terriglobales bacterium]